jgi:hypothetical protein
MKIMSGSIYLLNQNDKITELKETNYENENFFQSLIERYPNILAGDQIDPNNPRKWILISREMGVPDSENRSNQWSLDHLFSDQDAIPTFIEVKRCTDTRIRREVVAQMLDYAANGSAYWTIDTIKMSFEKSGGNLDVLGLQDEELEVYWTKFEDNLKNGKIRLMFVADEIPLSLRRIVEYLNTQMENTEVLALEIKQYVAENNVRTFVPHIIGQSIKAMDIKRRIPVIAKIWNEEDIIKYAKVNYDDNISNLLYKIINRFKELDCTLITGKGNAPSIHIRYKSNSLFVLYLDYISNDIAIELRLSKKYQQSKNYTDEIERMQRNYFSKIWPEIKNGPRPNVLFSTLNINDNYNTFINIFVCLIQIYDK